MLVAAISALRWTPGLCDGSYGSVLLPSAFFVVLIEVLALLGSVILMTVLFGKQLVLAVGKSAFGAKFAF